MSAISSIEWTDRTWNPVRGCSVVSPGCVNCYAMKQAHRFSAPGRAYAGLTKLTKAGPQWTGKIRTVESALLEPLSWKKPQRVFVNSMSDLFHDGVPFEFIDRVFAVMALCPKHTFQVLTKRAERMREYCADRFTRRFEAKAPAGYSVWWSSPLSNVWLGVSVEDQQRADERIPPLLQTPAVVRFISAEPLLGPVSFRWAKWDDHSPHVRRARQLPVVERDGRVIAGSVDHLDGLRMLDWVIVGGESGSGARPCDIVWIRAMLEQCSSAGVPAFVKQVGSRPFCSGRHGEWIPRDRKGGDPAEWSDDMRVRRFPEVRT